MNRTLIPIILGILLVAAYGLRLRDATNTDTAKESPKDLKEMIDNELEANKRCVNECLGIMTSKVESRLQVPFRPCNYGKTNLYEYTHRYGFDYQKDFSDEFGEIDEKSYNIGWCVASCEDLDKKLPSM